MPGWSPVYTPEQRRAIEQAYCDIRIRPIASIPRLAAAGQLTLDGKPLPAFDLTYASTRNIGKACERRRAGSKPASDLSPADNAERFRRRLETVIDESIGVQERACKRKGYDPDWQKLAQCARALRELAQVPAADDKRIPKAPGSSEGGTRTEGITKGSLAASILRSADKATDNVYTPPKAETPNDQDAEVRGFPTLDPRTDDQPLEPASLTAVITA